MQISRLFEIVYILLNRRQVTAKELAARFEVSVRTIYRDIEALSQAGVPVYATQGAGGGIHISDAYVLNKSALTDEEQAQILLALKSLTAADSDNAQPLLSRLGSLFNKDSAEWIEVDFSRWGNGQHDRRTLQAVKDGILGRRAIAFTYYSGHGARTEREAYPIKLVFKRAAWYMQAFCRQRDDYRTFKLVRMADVRLLPETFDRHSLPTPPPLETEPTAPMPPPPCAPVELRFGERISWRVMDEFNPGMIVRNDDGSMTVRVFFPQDDWLTGYILSFGSAVEVVSPPALRAHLRKTLTDLLAKYDPHPSE